MIDSTRARVLGSLAFFVLAGAVLAPTLAQAAPSKPSIGTLKQLKGSAGCVAGSAGGKSPCAAARALKGPGPFKGSGAIDVSPNGKNVYVASSKSDAIAVFKRDKRSGALTQPKGAAGCIAVSGADGCATAVGLDGVNSVAVSADGKNVYATAAGSDALTTFSRDSSTGSLTQATDGTGCVADAALTGCTLGRALGDPDVVVVSGDNANVYAGAFGDNAVVTFARNASAGTLTQPAGTAGCIAASSVDGCAVGLALNSIEGLAVSGDGLSVYAAAAVSNALVVLSRDASGTLTQASDSTGCVVNEATTGCTPGVRLSGANAVAVSPNNDNVYGTSLFSNSVTSFARSLASGNLTQLPNTSACVVNVLAVNCSLGRALAGPEGIAASRDGANVYVAAFGSSAIDVFDRNASSGALTQKSGQEGCVTSGSTPRCEGGRALSQVSSIALSPDGKSLYATAFKSNAVAIFRRVIR